MEDLIKRADAIKALTEVLFDEPPYLNSIEKCEAFARKTLESIPSAEPKQGEWIVHFDDLFPEESTEECSVCHAEQLINGNDDNFCPNCGARMKGADND